MIAQVMELVYTDVSELFGKREVCQTHGEKISCSHLSDVLPAKPKRERKDTKKIFLHEC